MDVDSCQDTQNHKKVNLMLKPKEKTGGHKRQ